MIVSSATIEPALEPVFGLAYLLAIQLMPCIRNWEHLNLYVPSDQFAMEESNTFISDPELRRTINATTNISDNWNELVKWAAFGGEGIIRHNNREEQRVWEPIV